MPYSSFLFDAPIQNGIHSHIVVELLLSILLHTNSASIDTTPHEFCFYRYYSTRILLLTTLLHTNSASIDTTPHEFCFYRYHSTRISAASIDTTPHEFLCSALSTVACLFVLFICAIVQSVLQGIIAADYHFGIFKLFSQTLKITILGYRDCVKVKHYLLKTHLFIQVMVFINDCWHSYGLELYFRNH